MLNSINKIQKKQEIMLKNSQIEQIYYVKSIFSLRTLELIISKFKILVASGMTPWPFSGHSMITTWLSVKISSMPK
jgi:type III secretory pathway component EscU